MTKKKTPAAAPAPAAAPNPGAHASFSGVKDGKCGVTLLARVLGLSERRIQQLKKEGMPSAGHGLYPFVECIQWYVKYWEDRAKNRVEEEREKAAGKKDGVLDELRVEKARKIRAEAELREHTLAEKRRMFVAFSELEQLLDEPLGALRTRLLMFPQTAADRILNIANRVDAMNVLDEMMRELMGDLARVGDMIEAGSLDAASAPAPDSEAA